jgi:hypothetical protein
MLQAHSTLRVLSRNFFKQAVLATAIAPALLSVGNAAGTEKVKNDRAVRLLATVPIPGTAANTTAGNMYVFDISWVDQRSRTYYLADRSNAAVEVVDTKTNILMAQLQAGFKGFTGNNGTSGPNGVATGGHCLFVTDAPSRVVSFDTSIFPPKMVSAVSTASGDLNRADEEAYDPADGVLLAINNADDPPFGTFIKVNPSTCGLTQPTAPPPGVTAPDRILFNTAGGVNATNGAEQPQWDPDTGRFYLSIPQIGLNASSGGVVRIRLTSASTPSGVIGTTFPISFCSPAGLTKGPNNDFLVGCNTVFDTAGGLWSQTDTKTAAPIQVILNVKTGDVDQVGGVGVGDEVWFNKGDGNYYTASSTSPLRPLDVSGPADAQGAAILGVIDAQDEEVLQLVPTFNVPAVTGTGAHPSGTAHSVAVDAGNNRVFAPLPANNVFPNCLTGCIAVYWHGDEDEPGQVASP